MKKFFTIFFIFLCLWVQANGTYGGGSGTSGDPYQITTAAHLATLATNVNAGTSYEGSYFKLMNDISLSTYPNWTPIGNITISSPAITGTPFLGNFNGNNFTISGLTIAVSAMTPKIGFGLFGYVGATGTVSNLNASGVSITINITTKKYVGALIGANQVTVDSCSSSGAINNTNLGAESIGGLVGENFGVASMVNNSHSSVNITAASYIGGLVGMNYGTIDSCYATGTIIGVERVGGLVGRNRSASETEPGIVTNSYSTGNVTGSSNYTGGCIGQNQFMFTQDNVGYIENCYSTGTVNGTGSYVGGFIGHHTNNNGGTSGGGYIKNCHATGKVTGGATNTGGFYRIVRNYLFRGRSWLYRGLLVIGCCYRCKYCRGFFGHFQYNLQQYFCRPWRWC